MKSAVLLLGLLPALSAQTLHYGADWKVWRAGTASLSYQDDQAILHLETTGFVGSLYKVNSDYAVQYNKQFCASSSVLTEHEGKRHQTKITYNQKPGKVELVELDQSNNNEVVETKELDVPPCVHDAVSALAKLRRMKLEPGAKFELPLTSGKKAASVRIEVQDREKIKTDLGEFNTIRVEAFMYNGVIYRRKARLFVWLTEDDRHLPVQIRIQMPWYVGTVTLKIEKEDRSG